MSAEKPEKRRQARSSDFRQTGGGHRNTSRWHGWCRFTGKHAQHVDLEKEIEVGMTRTQERLLMNVSKSTDSQCWHWTGQISNSGHGRIKIRGKDGSLRMQSAEHVSYEAFIGSVPDNMLVKQTCNNRLCINPEHLGLIDAPLT